MGDYLGNEGLLVSATSGVLGTDNRKILCKHGVLYMDYIVKRDVTPYSDGSLFASYVGSFA